MSQNLTNVYAYLRDSFEDVNMMFAKPVSYIKTLVGPDIQKVIFVYKEVNIKEQHTKYEASNCYKCNSCNSF